MKILIISDLYPPYHIGGYEINCRDTVEALSGRGHEVTVLTSSWGLDQKLTQGNVYRLLDFDPSFLEYGLHEHSEKFAYFINRLLQLQRIRVSRRNYDITRHIISKTQPEMAYLWHLGHLTVSPASAVQDAGLPACFRIEDYSFARVKQLADERVPLPKKLYRSLVFGRREMEKLHLTHLLFISQYVKNYYMKAGFPSAGMEVIPSGLPLYSLRYPLSRPNYPFVPRDGVVRLAFSGRVEPEKGPDVAIRAVARLKSESANPVVHLDIIGEGSPDFLAFLKQLADHLGISDRVSFLGKLDQKEVLMRFQYYDALLFTSRWQEPFGRVVIEAMAQGLPVIATQNGGVPEIIDDFQNGLLVSPDNPRDLAEAIRKLLQDPVLAAQLSHNAFITIRSRFTLERIVSRMEEYIFEVVKAKRVSAYGNSH